MYTVIELVEMTKYIAYGGFDPSTKLRDRRLNHRKLNFLVTPLLSFPVVKFVMHLRILKAAPINRVFLKYFFLLRVIFQMYFKYQFLCSDCLSYCIILRQFLL